MAGTEARPGAISGTTTLHLGLTDAGKVILRGIVFIALATLIIPAFDVLSVLVCVMAVALVVGFVVRPRVLVTGHLPERVIAGETVHLTYTIKNTGRLPAYNLRVRFRALPDAIEQTGDAQPIWRLEPGRTAEVALAIRPKRRGCYRLRPPICESSFPFNLFHFGSSREGEESLLVLPAFSLLDLTLPWVSRHVDACSLRPAGRQGNSPEYIGSRPFQPGDSRRRIDVRAWARLAAPATKEYDDDLDNYVALVLDTRRLKHGWAGLGALSKGAILSPGPAEARRPRHFGRGRSGPATPSRKLEAAISLCASMAYTLARDCLVDLLLAGPDLHSFALLPKEMRVDRVHETLAAVEPSEDYTAEQIGPLLEDRLGEISEVVFIVQQWDRTYQQLAQWAERAGCHCTAIIVGEVGVSDFGLRMADGGLKEAAGTDLQSATRDPQWPAASVGEVQFVSADELLAGRGDVRC